VWGKVKVQCVLFLPDLTNVAIWNYCCKAWDPDSGTELPFSAQPGARDYFSLRTDRAQAEERGRWWNDEQCLTCIYLLLQHCSSNLCCITPLFKLFVAGCK
jgi:hypothetical protein